MSDYLSPHGTKLDMPQVITRAYDEVTNRLRVDAVVGTSTPSSTAILTNVPASLTSVQLLAANPLRKVATCFNESTGILYLKFGAIASNSSYTVQIAPGGYYELPQPVYTGEVDGIWTIANGFARMTEY